MRAVRLKRELDVPGNYVASSSIISSLLILLLISLLVSSCENNLKDVERISSKKVSVPVDKSYGVQVIYSDSAVVKAKMNTPVLFHYETKSPYYEMPKGVTVIFYDPAQKETSRVTSDYAISRENEKVVELRKNVVATNPEGKTFKSDELFWDENKKRFYSNKLVSITTKSETIYGTSFWANEDFTYYEIRQSTGNFDVKQKDQQGLPLGN
ncbi:LPS export ABC transporter periplasmic protein LptC [Pedobacter sp. HMF7647]|uniref:LPS export ABC transporter periplasmic protein LptC n=1 Tax=Hufsiella arboris TaxID=2695275 RepID=A0A7K1YAS8_9SPHI|nr:LPS export ABC transporter periplasmic protein LptC [Hufsiella arboris]MXV51686.1 LPS export ABC transporter periplasmic protein LptC [Hufsiella arboris]